MFNLTINRDIWLRNAALMGASTLLNSFGKECCLGILCETAGIPRQQMLYVSTPSNLVSRESLEKFGMKRIPAELLWLSPDLSLGSPPDSSLANLAMCINDGPITEDETRPAWFDLGRKEYIGSLLNELRINHMVHYPTDERYSTLCLMFLRNEPERELYIQRIFTKAGIEITYTGTLTPEAWFNMSLQEKQNQANKLLIDQEGGTWAE